MTEQLDKRFRALGLRWVKAGCTWRSGTLWERFEGDRMTHGGRVNYHMPEAMPGAIPDLRDPATLGCLLADVREAWGQPLSTHWDGLTWVVFDEGLNELAGADGLQGEADALVCALEMAPR